MERSASFPNGISRPQGLFTSSIGLEAALISPLSPKHGKHSLRDGAEPLNVIIPMGGLFKSSSAMPPPLRNIVGRPILFWLLDHLALGPDDKVWIGVPKEVDDSFALSKQLRSEFAALNICVVPLLFPTSGPIETIFVMLQSMDAVSLKRRTISLDSATLYFSDVLGAFRQVKPECGASFYFVQSEESTDSAFSYIKLSGGLITDIREKVASNLKIILFQ